MTLSLGEYALLKNLGNANHAAADLFSHGLIMLSYAARNSPRETAMEAFEALVETSRKAFIEIIEEKK